MHAANPAEKTQAKRSASTRSGGEEGLLPETNKLNSKPRRQHPPTKATRYGKDRFSGLNNHQTPKTRPKIGNQKYHPKRAKIGEKMIPSTPVVQPNTTADPAKKTAVAMMNTTTKVFTAGSTMRPSQCYYRQPVHLPLAGRNQILPADHIRTRREIEWIRKEAAFCVARNVRYKSGTVSIVTILIRLLNACFGCD
ncbi:MAG TPA: hypothetical protein VJA21_09755 [Verrucomicrobiae bacterium]